MSELKPELIVYALALLENVTVDLTEAERLRRLLGESREEFVAHLFLRRRSFDGAPELKQALESARKLVAGPRTIPAYPYDRGKASSATQRLEEKMTELMKSFDANSEAMTQLQSALAEFRRSVPRDGTLRPYLDEPLTP